MQAIIEMMTRDTADQLKQHFKQCSEALSEDNDCAVRALASVSGISYNEVNKWLIDGGYRSPRTGTQCKPYQKFLEAHDIKSRVVLVNAKTIRSFQQKCYQGKFLVRVRGHILAVIDGQAIDWADMRLNRIREVIQIIEN